VGRFFGNFVEIYRFISAGERLTGIGGSQYAKAAAMASWSFLPVAEPTVAAALLRDLDPIGLWSYHEKAIEWAGRQP
jgi:hypothetical protein